MRRRWVKVLAIVVVVLAVLGTVVDRLADNYAEQQAAQLAQQKYGYGQGTTDGYTHVAIDGFPFLTQALSGQLDHVTLDAGNFTLDTSEHPQGGYLNVRRLTLDLHDLQVTSLTARSAQAQLVTGDLTLSYQDLSGVVTRLMSRGGALTVGPAPGSNEQEARIRVTGAWDGRQVDAVGSLLAQGDEIEIQVPGVGQGSYDYPVTLPSGVGFDAATSTATGVDVHLVGHQVLLGSSAYGR
ncbi:LmeA family phospholipid-binding protein [Streptacidiphilus melanogenes]|uniref:LmeA family phospholipid-binding protein n=1 Tax=Streptacidiphilus melanogenes TaxID=411235 RepID=UPI000B086AD7|nr:DUF2993 domain-containing protein [Streptacidiphilus melanogenes]